MRASMFRAAAGAGAIAVHRVAVARADRVLSTDTARNARRQVVECPGCKRSQHRQAVQTANVLDRAAALREGRSAASALVATAKAAVAIPNAETEALHQYLQLNWSFASAESCEFNPQSLVLFSIIPACENVHLFLSSQSLL